MQNKKYDCADCDRLWRDFGTITRRYIALISSNPAPLVEVLDARKERMRLADEMRSHEWAAHGGERVMSEAI